MLVALAAAASASTLGYYREPTLRGDTVVFVAEGDLWRIPVTGGTASRLTTHPAAEGSPQLSPDGFHVAFSAAYEGGTEVYVMPVDGGRPERLTWTGSWAAPTGWTPDGRVIVATEATSGLPDPRLLLVHPETRAVEPVPLAQAANGSYGPDGTLYFTRLPFQGSHTKRYRGGTAQDVWMLAPGAPEAVRVTEELGTDKDPVLVEGRLYVLSDRDGAASGGVGAMNVWSLAPDGSDGRALTTATDVDVRSFSVDGDRLVYRQGADLHLVDLLEGGDAILPVRLDSDFDQTREQWVATPYDWLTQARLSPNGDRVALTARGQVFVVPTGQGRIVTLEQDGVRYREGAFLAGGDVLAMSDASGEVELWRLPGNGVGEGRRLTSDGGVLRVEAAPSPDGRRVAHTDRDHRLWLLDLDAGTSAMIDESPIEIPASPAWSMDGRWLAYVVAAPNLSRVVRLYDTESGRTIDASTDRASTYSPSFSHDGRWLYVLTDRHFETVVDDPWSPIWSEPFWDEPTLILAIALQPGLRSPFAPADELHPEPVPGEAEDESDRKRRRRKDPPGTVEIAAEGLTGRLATVPLPNGNLSDLQAGVDRLFWTAFEAGEPGRTLYSAPIAREDVEPTVLVEDVWGYELSADRRKVLVVREDGIHVFDAAADGEVDLGGTAVDLSGWRLSVSPRDEWRQMFDEAWRLERDYFYDRGMHGVDWPAVRERYRPLVERVADRAELADLVAQMVSELSALHTFVFGGEHRRGDDPVRPASLGADLVPEAGGFRVARVWASDPERPGLRSPLAALGSEVAEGELVTAIDGVPTAGVPDPGALLRGKAGRQVLLHVRGTPVKPRKPAPERDVVVVPISAGEAADRRYHEWELTRRQRVEERGEGKLAYIHLRAMGAEDMDEWMRAYLPIFTREGLVVDVRHNGGGNIDSWVLERLMRKVWMYWSQRVGSSPSWNMQYAFRGHLVVLCDEGTGSDGEAFAEGFRRLGLGPVIGTRTWGGEIWLSMSNVLVDGGIASAAEFGVYGPEGEWLIEGHGVEPDTVVDNLPVATFHGGDAQLDAAIDYLQRRLAEAPVPPYVAPEHPDKSRLP